ncbi:hypothetical protein GCM10022421_02170 [Oceanisphaera sediminis]|uniref:Lysozyme inhibitor LprI-like N-terminal domain-containing protein n=1 Tax=Oceanisphaera sediminis TaxID=981381 RepID=A0ABP7D1I2_9GAMM
MKTILILFTLTCFWFMPPGYGQNATQVELNEQSRQHYQTADQALNQAYGRLMNKLDPARKQKLKTAQRAWLKFRDAQAELVSSAYEGGSIQPLSHSEELKRLTENRTKELEQQLQDESL